MSQTYSNNSSEVYNTSDMVGNILMIGDAVIVPGSMGGEQKAAIISMTDSYVTVTYTTTVYSEKSQKLETLTMERTLSSEHVRFAWRSMESIVGGINDAPMQD